MEWLSPLTSQRCSSDPLFGKRPDGPHTRFWENDTTSMDPMNNRTVSPSTASLCRKAREAGFSSEQIDATMKLLADQASGHLIVSALPPTTMDQPTAVARKIVSTLFRSHKPTDGVWKGPLPSPRVSPSLTLGDCPVNDCTGGPRSHR